MIKKASELGLKVIEYDDHILLTRGSEIRLDDPDPSKMRYAIESSNLVAATIPIERTSLLVIENEVEKLAYEAELEETKNCNPYDQYYGGHDFNKGFQDGYNKAKETYKFTEEDLRKAIDMAKGKFNENNVLTFTSPPPTVREIIQSLTKKELWIEVEEKIALDGHTVIGFEPKITSNQIKAVWK